MPEKLTDEELLAVFHVTGSFAETARVVGISRQGVQDRLGRKFGVRNPMGRTGKLPGPQVMLMCECGNVFGVEPATASRRRYCSKECRGIASRKDLIYSREKLVELHGKLGSYERVAKLLGVHTMTVWRRIKGRTGGTP